MRMMQIMETQCSLYLMGSVGLNIQHIVKNLMKENCNIVKMLCSLCLYLLLWKFLREKILWP